MRRSTHHDLTSCPSQHRCFTWSSTPGAPRSCPRFLRKGWETTKPNQPAFESAFAQNYPAIPHNGSREAAPAPGCVRETADPGNKGLDRQTLQSKTKIQRISCLPAKTVRFLLFPSNCETVHPSPANRRLPSRPNCNRQRNLRLTPFLRGFCGNTEPASQRKQGI
jgi:hypothetical protein